MMTPCDILNRHDECIDHTFHPGKRADALIILGHGVTGNKDRPLLVALATALSARGWPCLRISFSGNGESGGAFADSNITKEIGDLQAVLNAVPNDVRVAYIGHSMGGAVGVLAAARDMRIFTLVSLAGMTHTAEFVRREFGDVTPGAGFMWDDESFPLSQAFVDDLTSLGDTLSAAEAVTQPWLLIHGTADEVVPMQDGRDAFAAATCEKQWLEIPGAEHAFDDSSYPQIVDGIENWLLAHIGPA
jgi:pimeloyl-ACP methyl ester carboxylesterase